MIWNHYRCEQCGQLTIAKHDQDGVTPFRLRCRATLGCKGDAFSLMYRGPQDPDQVPHVVWYRPDPAQLDAEILANIAAELRRGERMPMTASERRRLHLWMREHYEKGGCLMRVEVRH